MLGKGKGAAALMASRKAFGIGLFARRRSVIARHGPANREVPTLVHW